jgi:hypothetical protein
MDKNDLQALLTKLQLNKNIALQDIPEIDLYMDQVIQLFENSFSSILRNEDEKVLTKTMINNYSKDRLLMPIKNKKYSKEHIILLSLIYQLKGSLSISDIKKILTPMLKSFEADDSFPLREFYDTYNSLLENNMNEFQKEILKKLEDVNSSLENESDINKNYDKCLLLILSLVNMSNLYRRTSEKIIDELFDTMK